jgi:hypothetical protein
VAGADASGVGSGELGTFGSGTGVTEGVGSVGMGDAEPPTLAPLTCPDVDPVPPAPPPAEPPDDGFVAVASRALTVDLVPDWDAPTTDAEDSVPAGGTANDSGRSGSDAAASVATGSSSDSGSCRRRSTSDAVRTRTGASATTSRTADTAAKPTAAAPAAMAAHAVIDSQRYLMTPVCPLVRLIPH